MIMVIDVFDGAHRVKVSEGQEFILADDINARVVSIQETHEVFLIWDDSRAEHGEGSSLVCIYGNKESAERHIERERDAADLDDPDSTEDVPFSIEERMVIG